MRKILILFWFLVPVAMAAYHYGPGQELMTVDGVGSSLRQAETLVDEAKALVVDDKQQAANLVFARAIKKFDEAIETLPKGNVRDIQRIRLEKAKALFASQQNPTARTELGALLDELNEEAADAQDDVLIADTQRALAASQFYMTWLMRIEGHPREVWEPEALRSRQNYQALAERAERIGGSDAEAAKEELEASVRLALVDLADLQGLPLPSQ